MIQNFKLLNKPIPIILGGYVNGLGLVRGLGEAGIDSIIVDYKKNISFYSKYTLFGLVSPHPAKETDKFIEFMINLGKKLSFKGVLYCTNDIWLIPISMNQNLLEEFFYYPMSKWNIIEKCINKSKLYNIAKESGIPYPKTLIVDTINDIKKIENDLSFPIILKPAITIGFIEKLGSKGRTLIIRNDEEFKFWKNKIIERQLDNIPLILQEEIPGKINSLYTISAYSNKNGEIIAYSTGYKIRQYPPDAGTILSGRVESNNDLLDFGKQLIKYIGFHGISNTEFKKDERTGEFKLIEINPRPGMWNYSATATGINLPYIAYQEVFGKESKLIEANEENIIWIQSLPDFWLSIWGYKKNGYNAYSLSLKDWLNSIQGRKIDATFQANDIYPGVIFFLSYIFGK